MSTPCYSGIVPSDAQFQNLVVNKDLRAQNAAIGKLCALIENGNGAFIGALDVESTPALDTAVFPNGHTTQGTNVSPSLTSFYYAPVDIELENFEVGLTSDVAGTYTVSVATTTDPAVAPVAIASLEVPIEIATGGDVVRAVAVGPHTIVAGTYITITVVSTETAVTVSASWSLDYHLI